MLAKAISLAAQAFEGKQDKAGKPYILHCLRVMSNVNQSDPELMAAAVLHDLLEDCPDFGPADLYKLGFSDRVVTAIKVCTHHKDISYEDYIKNIALNRDAREIKIADLKDNSDITRLKGLRKKDHDRIQKYHWAWVYLSN